LSILPIFLDPKSDLELTWEFLRFALEIMNFDGTAFAVVESPVILNECFHGTFTRRVLVFINFRLTFLCILRAKQSGDPNQREPICNK
jgi:hypothetical protein